MRDLFLVLLAGCSFVVQGARRRSTRARIRDEIVEDVLASIDFYANNFHINDTIARNIFEGALHTAARAKGPAEREKALIEFYETGGAGNISRVASMNGFLMASVPGLVEKYIFGNDLKTTLKKTFALIFDEEFKKGTYRQKEEKLTCLVINCTEMYLHAELRNLASTFVEITQPILLENMNLFDSNNVHESTFFDQLVDITMDKNRTLSQRSLDLGKLYEEKTSAEFKNKMARQMAKLFRSSFGPISRVVKSGQEERIYQKLAKLPFDREYRDLDEEERKKRVVKILFSVEEEGQEKAKEEESTTV